MPPNGHHSDFSHLQDVMGTLPMLKRYIVLCLCFPLAENYSAPYIESTLTQALERLAEAFPFLAGQVIIEGRQDGSSGIPKIVPLEERIRLHVNELRYSDLKFPSMAEMSAAKYPFAVLDPAIILPPIALEWAQDPNDFSQTAPVLILQANFVRGGLLLTFSCNHMTADMTGLGLIISLLAKACRGERFTEVEIEQGNQPRGDIVPLLGDEYEPGPELEDVFVIPRAMEEKTNPSPPQPVSASPPSPQVVWAYFNFKSSNLARLKEDASQQTLVPYVSTDDAVGALCWQAVTRARAHRLGRPITSTFARPLSARKYLGLHGLYLGHLVDVVYESGDDIHRRPLGDTAGRLRRILQDEEKITHHVRAYATMIDRLPEKSKLLNGARLDPDRDVVLSSYANIGCCQTSFGPVLGMPEAARRPRMAPWPSLLYLMPKDKEGDIAVAVCLREDELMMIRRDEAWSAFADYMG